MLIFLEGPDGAGKTNLAKRLADLYGYGITHFSYPKTKAEKLGQFDMYADFIYHNDNMIVDRCWYSDMVYSQIIRNEFSTIGRAKMWELEKLVMAQHGGQVIHCTAKVQKLYARMKDRGDDYVPLNFTTITAIKQDYEKLFHKTPHLLPVFKYEVNENVPKL